MSVAVASIRLWTASGAGCLPITPVARISAAIAVTCGVDSEVPSNPSSPKCVTPCVKVCW